MKGAVSACWRDAAWLIGFESTALGPGHSPPGSLTRLLVLCQRFKTCAWLDHLLSVTELLPPEAELPQRRPAMWLDWLPLSRDELYARLHAPQHRRFTKTHSPLGGVPFDPRVTCIVAARHPLDMAVSLYHQSANIDHERLRRLTEQPKPDEPAASRAPLGEWLLHWIDDDVTPQEQLDSMPGVMWHANCSPATSFHTSSRGQHRWHRMHSLCGCIAGMMTRAASP